jgi:hypothetical protein
MTRSKSKQKLRRFKFYLKRKRRKERSKLKQVSPTQDTFQPQPVQPQNNFITPVIEEQGPSN